MKDRRVEVAVCSRIKSFGQNLKRKRRHSSLVILERSVSQVGRRLQYIHTLQPFSGVSGGPHAIRADLFARTSPRLFNFIWNGCVSQRDEGDYTMVEKRGVCGY